MPETTIDPVARLPVPAKVMSELTDLILVPERVSATVATLLVIVSESLNWMLAEIVSAAVPVFVMAVLLAPSKVR